MAGKNLVNDPEVRAQVRDYIGAPGELGPGWEDVAAEALLARLEKRLDVLVERRLRERRRKPSLAWFTVTPHGNRRGSRRPARRPGCLGRPHPG